MGSKSMCFLGGVYDSEVTFRRVEGKFKEMTEEHVGPKSAFLRPGSAWDAGITGLKAS